MIRRIKIAYLWFCILTLFFLIRRIKNMFFLIRRSTAACGVLITSVTCDGIFQLSWNALLSADFLVQLSMV